MKVRVCGDVVNDELTMSGEWFVYHVVCDLNDINDVCIILRRLYLCWLKAAR